MLVYWNGMPLKLINVVSFSIRILLRRTHIQSQHTHTITTRTYTQTKPCVFANTCCAHPSSILLQCEDLFICRKMSQYASALGLTVGDGDKKVLQVLFIISVASCITCYRHEGRVWYTPHRGRLWIASTRREPSADDITTVEQLYKSLHPG